LSFVFENQTNCPFPKLRRIPLRCLHNSILSKNGVSGNPRAVHILDDKVLGHTLKAKLTDQIEAFRSVEHE
jgi:hypothetical protein